MLNTFLHPRAVLSAAMLIVAANTCVAARADDNLRPLADVLNIDATVSTDVVPDTAVVTMAILREGPDVAPLTNDVNQVLAKAFNDAKAVPGVIASNGGYTTQPRYDSRGNQSTRDGWQVRAQIVLKSRDFNALGGLVGRLGQTLQIVGSNFEISPELSAREGAALIDRGARAFQDKALAAAKAFGYGGYAIREVTVGSAGQSFAPRPMMRVAAPSSVSSAAPLPVEAGQATLSVTVNGSVVMRR